MKKLVALVMTALCLLAVGCSKQEHEQILSLIHIPKPTRPYWNSFAVSSLKKKKYATETILT